MSDDDKFAHLPELFRRGNSSGRWAATAGFPHVYVTAMRGPIRVRSFEVQQKPA